MRYRKTLLTLVTLLLFVSVIPLIVSARKGAFDPHRVLDPLPPITEFQLKSVAEVDTELNPREFVIGVVINGQSRAYAINMLTGPHREIINDELGGSAIAATW
jgi:hypothetical protein